MILPSLLVAPLFVNDTLVALFCDLRGCMALSVRSPQAMARRTVRSSVQTTSGTEQVAEPSTDRAMRLPRWSRGAIWVSLRCPSHFCLGSTRLIRRLCHFFHRLMGYVRRKIRLLHDICCGHHTLDHALAIDHWNPSHLIPLHEMDRFADVIIGLACHHLRGHGLSHSHGIRVLPRGHHR